MDEKSGEKKTNRGRKGDQFLLPSLSTSRLVRRQDSKPRSDSSIDESMPRNLAKEKETMAAHLIQEGGGPNSLALMPRVLSFAPEVELTGRSSGLLRIGYTSLSMRSLYGYLVTGVKNDPTRPQENRQSGRAMVLDVKEREALFGYVCPSTQATKSGGGLVRFPPKNRKQSAMPGSDAVGLSALTVRVAGAAVDGLFHVTAVGVISIVQIAVSGGGGSGN
ncbi:hypothetical protein Nepgr_009310 [Nepenthes gracilis]|uniref:Uncharacterized protein n=1 Tax=Nepenthes gracilis TaxID=150966 RepID=A0AAD3XK83_NEPGR|nr:hypothetical protein Nepgr_009310 [Nepenthes gracilis]